MNKKRKINLILAVFIIITGVLALTGIIVFSYLYYQRTPQYFVEQRKNIANSYYNEIVNYDFENNYPASPEAVMELIIKINMLIYGDMLLNNELIETLLVQQRMMYSDALLEMNPFEQQYENLVAGLEKYREMETVCHSIIQDDPVYVSDDKNEVTINIIQSTNNLGALVWKYQLEMDEGSGRYKITGFSLE